jgi:hypothetical protein
MASSEGDFTRHFNAFKKNGGVPQWNPMVFK